MIEQTPKSKIAQLRAEHRKRQRRITFVSQLPGVFGVFVFAAAQLRHNFSQEVTGAAVVFFIALAAISWFIARAMKNAPDPYGFKDEGFSGDGVCPDCGAKDTLEYRVDEKKYRAKRIVGYLVALVIPALVFVYFFVLIAIDPSSGSLLFLPLVSILFLPLIVGFSNLNVPRIETCSACGRDEYVPFDQSKYNKGFLIGFIEKVWVKIWARKWWVVWGLTIAPTLVFFIYDRKSGFMGNTVISLAAIVVVVAFWLLITSFSANRFYNNFFGLKKTEEKPDNKTVVQTPVTHHP
jgi:hypothetical protein